MSDKYGDYGLISAVFLEKKSDDTIFIDTWIMSCRVLKRGVEWMVLNEIVKTAAESGFKYIESEYLATAKNGMVRDHYTLLGFEELDESGHYRLERLKNIYQEIILFKKQQIMLTISEVLIRLQKCFRDILDNDDIVLNPETTADDIEEWDSLSHIQLIVALEKKFKIKFTTAEITSYKNVGQMAESIVRKISLKNPLVM